MTPESKLTTRFVIEYINRGLEFKQRNPSRRFLQIETMPLNLEEIARYFLFDQQLHSNRIPENSEYEILAQPVISGKGLRSSIVSGVHLQARFRGDAMPPVYSLGTISLQSHSHYFSSYLVSKVAINESKDFNGKINNFRLLDLAVGHAEPEKSHGMFSFVQPEPKSFQFISGKRPGTSGFICWGGGSISKNGFMVYISRAVLDRFAQEVKHRHPREIAAQLGGELYRDGEQKFLQIDQIFMIDAIGDEASLRISARELIRTSQLITRRHARVTGWVHSHGFAENALMVSAIDIKTQHENFTMPYGVMIVADGVRLQSRKDYPKQCCSCSYFRVCTFGQENYPGQINGWSVYTWSKEGAITPIRAWVYEPDY